ncbi:MAG: creatininase family protein [Cyanobacteriota bacterium]|nr:creatininase family protein [Cyanobacteriota bacterium]
MASRRSLTTLSWPQVQACAARAGSTVVWPWGAIEQHGPQLPLGTDALFAERVLAAVLERLPESLPIWTLPPQRLGFSPEHLSFPGTLSLSAELVLQLVVTVGRQLAGCGFQRLVLFNAHGGQIALLQVAARQIHARWPRLAVLPCFLWSGPRQVLDAIPEPERSGGLHAGRAETSLMLALAPGLVGPLPPAEPGPVPPPGFSLEGAVPCAWTTRDISASGVVGDPTGAGAAEGEQLFEGLVQGWTVLLADLLATPWPHRRPGLGTVQRPTPVPAPAGVPAAPLV